MLARTLASPAPVGFSNKSAGAVSERVAMNVMAESSSSRSTGAEMRLSRPCLSMRFTQSRRSFQGTVCCGCEPADRPFSGTGLAEKPTCSIKIYLQLDKELIRVSDRDPGIESWPFAVCVAQSRGLFAQPRGDEFAAQPARRLWDPRGKCIDGACRLRQIGDMYRRAIHSWRGIDGKANINVIR